MAISRLCSILGCDKPHQARGLCWSHYLRWRRHGDPLGGRTPEGRTLLFLERALAETGVQCVEWPFAKTGNGYSKIWLSGQSQRVHRLICTTIHGKLPTSKHEAAHSCGNRLCVNPNHISWKTKLANEADKIAHGTEARGTKNGASKLSENDVRQIRALAGVIPQRAIAKAFNINQSLVSQIYSRTLWAWLE